MSTRVRITVDSGRVLVVGETRDDVGVEGAKSTLGTDEVTVHGGSKPFVVRVPTGTDVVIGSRSGKVTLEGVLGAASITTSSADVTVSEVASIDARTLSGKLRVGVSHGRVRLRTESSVVHVGRADGEVRVASVSGRVEVTDARGALSARTVSGRIDVVVAGTDAVTVETVSGKVRITLPSGVRPEVHLTTISGKRKVEVETGTDVAITGRSVSGAITVGGS